MSSTFKAALASLLDGDRLAVEDRAHLQRWYTDWVDDPALEKVTRTERPDLGDPTAIPYKIVFAAMQARRIAEDAMVGLDRAAAAMTENRLRWLSLADKAQALADFYGAGHLFETQEFFEQRLMSLPALRELMARQAELLRECAGEEPKPTTRISRQRSGSVRPEARKYVAFMDYMVQCMRLLCGQPHYAAVSAITNITFPEADVDAEDVRSATKPTTRLGRRPKGGAPSD